MGTLKLTTYQDGVPVEPDDIPSVSVTDSETGGLEVNLVSEGDAIIVNPNYPGDYYYEIPSEYTEVDRVLKVAWSYYINGRHIQEVEYAYVVTPYATVDEIISELGYSSRPEDQNYFSYDKIRSAERAARMMISNELGFTIGQRVGTTTAYGSGADVLVLSEKIKSISRLYENNELVVDVSENYNIFGYGVEITETGYGIRIVPANPGDDIDEQESIDFFGYSKGRFRDGYRYQVSGVLGWSCVPAEIKQCVFLLVNDLLCNDSIWRSRYVKKINSGQMSVELSSLTFSGTGNAIVDSILQKFKMIQAVII